MNRFWSWIQIDPLLTKRKNDCYIFIPSDLDLWPLKRKFALTVTHVSTKCEVCMSFLFRANQTQRTDGHGATLNAASTARAAYHAVVCSVLAGKAYLKAGRRGRRHATVDLVVANMFHRSSFYVIQISNSWWRHDRPVSNADHAAWLDSPFTMNSRRHISPTNNYLRRIFVEYKDFGTSCSLSLSWWLLGIL